MSNEEVNEVVQNKNDLRNIDLSNLIIIKNVDDEILIGYNIEGKCNTIISNSDESEKLLQHHNYGTIINHIQNQQPDNLQPLIYDPQRYINKLLKCVCH